MIGDNRAPKGRWWVPLGVLILSIAMLYFLIKLEPGETFNVIAGLIWENADKASSATYVSESNANVAIISLMAFACMKIVCAISIVLSLSAAIRAHTKDVGKDETVDQFGEMLGRRLDYISDGIIGLHKRFGSSGQAISNMTREDRSESQGVSERVVKEGEDDPTLTPYYQELKSDNVFHAAKGKKYILGIDVGGSKIKLGIVNKSNICLSNVECETSKYEESKDGIVSALRKLFDNEAVMCDDIAAVGIAWPAPTIDGRPKRRAINIDIDLNNLKRILEKCIGNVAVCVINDANAAAFGEYKCRGYKDGDSLALVTLGTGMGCGLILHGKPWEGAFGYAGEIGHIICSRGEARECRCGHNDCTEKYLSSVGLEENYREAIKSGGEDTGETVDAKSIMVRAKTDDATKKVVIEYAQSLGVSLAQLANTIDPGLISIGGGISGSLESYLPEIRDSFEKNVIPGLECTRIEIAELENNAGIVGAAAYAGWKLNYW